MAFALSLILHALLLFGWLPKVPMLPFDDSRLGKPSGALAVRLAPLPSRLPIAAAAPPPARAVLAQPARRAPARKAAPRPPSAPRILALERSSPALAAPPPAKTARPPATEDLASYIAAHRRAEPVPAQPPPSPPAETEDERHNRAVAASLGLNRTPSFGSERQRGGGMFQIERIGYNDAEFFFYGWNKDIRRNSQQMIEVQRGDNPTMEIAVVRKMIAIIREHVSGDFVWESERLNRDVTLSARAADNAGLEDFLMLEFFSNPGSRH
jgi:hypothetical protein